MRYCLLIISVVLFGCNQPPNKTAQKKETVHKDTAALNRAAGREQALKEERLDSLKKEDLVNQVIAFIKGNHITQANKTLNLSPDSMSSTYIRVGYLFSKKMRHAVLRVKKDGGVIVYVYRLDNYDRILRETMDDWYGTNYLGDQLKDINGDGIKDLVIQWYPSSGCCRRYINLVYLYQPNGTFTSGFTFPNPTFYPYSKLIRGVEYGHSGEVPLYKYRWNGFKLDTVEYIYPADTLKHKFCRVHKYDEAYNPQKRETLTKVPAEYLHINEYDWFMNY